MIGDVDVDRLDWVAVANVKAAVNRVSDMNNTRDEGHLAYYAI